MTDPAHTTTEQIEADLEAQRERLAQTVDELGSRLDVRSRARHKSADVRDRLTTSSGKPRPELLGLAAGLVLVVGTLVWRRRRR